jgi:hypothetical protein
MRSGRPGNSLSLKQPCREPSACILRGSKNKWLTWRRPPARLRPSLWSIAKIIPGATPKDPYGAVNLVQSEFLVGKIGGAFGSYTHSGESAGLIFDTMQHVFRMDMVDLGALNLKENLLDMPDGIKACQEYGKAVAGKLTRRTVNA